MPGGTFRHGKVFGAPMGSRSSPYYAEWEFPDMDAFKAAARTDEFMATGKDAAEMGVPFHVHFADDRMTEPDRPAPATRASSGSSGSSTRRRRPARRSRSTGRRS